MTLLEIKDLHLNLEEGDKEILKGFNLTVGEGEVHAIMGLNGSGKSTLSYYLAGKEDYVKTKGDVLFKGEDLDELEACERANEGLFLAFQYPTEIPGVATSTFLRHAYNAKLKHNGEDEISPIDFVKLLKSKAAEMNISDDMLKRFVNVGYSGGEKKRAEILQMSLLQPDLAILDESDSGLDIDALKLVAEGVNSLKDGKRSFILITHYQRLLDYIKPDFVHVMADGKILETGDSELAKKLDSTGYAEYQK